MGVLTVRLPDEIDARWRRYCAERGLKPTATVSRLLEQVLTSSPASPDSSASAAKYRSVGPERDAERRVRVSAWLTASEHETVQERARAHGISRARWIAMVLRAALTREPQFCATELEALDQSTRQLAGLGRDLNQLVRRLNAVDSEPPTEATVIEALRADVEHHMAHVNRLVRSCAERWALEPHHDSTGREAIHND